MSMRSAIFKTIFKSLVLLSPIILTMHSMATLPSSRLSQMVILKSHMHSSPILSNSNFYSSAPDGSNKKKDSRPKKILRQVDHKAQAHFQARVKAMKQVCGSLKLELATRLCLVQIKYLKILLLLKFLFWGLIMVRTGFIIYGNISTLFAASLPTCHMMGSGEGAGGRGWTDLFGSCSTGNSETGGNSVGSSEGSINQPAPHSPEPVAPEGDRGGPWIPEDPNENHLMPAQQRMEELAHRLTTNSINKQLSPKEWGSIVAAQITVEEKIESTLVNDGFSPDAILAKRHQMRGFMFYPKGTSLTESTYVSYVRSVENLGPKASVPYKRIMKAIENQDLFI